MEQKKYHDIIRLGARQTIGVLNKGAQIVIQEKIDGANASFRIDGDIIRAYSRNNELNLSNNLGGFWQFTQELNPKLLYPHLIYFGEWLNPHKVKYPEYQKQFFLYDVYNTETGEYMPFSIVKREAYWLKLNVIPVFYEGEYQSFEHLQSFVGRTALGGKLGDINTGEGIVAKNINYKDRFGNQVFVKLVTDAFREVQKQKEPKDPSKITQEQVFVNSTMTEARVDKLLYKFIDEGILNEHFGIEDMGLILKNIKPRIYEDIMKEESDMLPDNYDDKEVHKAIGRNVAKIIKNIIDKS